MNEPQKYPSKWENANADDYIFYGSILMKFPEKANLDL